MCTTNCAGLAGAYMRRERPGQTIQPTALVHEALRDGENACLVRSADPESLASGIANVLGDQPFAARIARSAFEEASSYTWARRAERLEALFEMMAKRS